MDSSWFSKELGVKMLKDPDKIYGKEDQHIKYLIKNSKLIIQQHTQLQHVCQTTGAKR